MRAISETCVHSKAFRCNTVCTMEAAAHVNTYFNYSKVPLACQEALCHKGIGELCKVLRDDDELRGQRVTEDWLRAYLDAGQQAAVSRLSVFVGSFNAVGASAVARGAGAALYT